jgi:hypothetical protein
VRVNDRVLFCNVHWPQLPPKYQAPIQSNQEAPRYASVDDARAVISGVGAAVNYLAGKEGRKQELAEAQAAAASAPPIGTTSEEVDTSGNPGVASVAGTTAGGSARGGFTSDAL